MAIVQVWNYWSVTIDGQLYEFGSLSSPVAVPVAGGVIDPVVHSIANNTTVDSWVATSEEALSDFDFLFIVSDFDVFVELTVDQNAGVGKVVSTVQVKGTGVSGKYGVPLQLGSDTAKANYSEDFAGGSDDVIDRLRIRNESGSTAKVARVLVS